MIRDIEEMLRLSTKIKNDLEEYMKLLNEKTVTNMAVMNKLRKRDALAEMIMFGRSK
jgi:hypothetical protein